MRWKLLRRRWSISAPRMIVRSRLPWPVRWAVASVVIGFCAAMTLWAFQLGQNLAGKGGDDRVELGKLRAEVAQLKADHARSRLVSNTSEILLKTERAAQEYLAAQVRQLESDKRALLVDLGLFERLVPAISGAGKDEKPGGVGARVAQTESLQLRGLRVEPSVPGQLRYRMLVLQPGKPVTDFSGQYQLVLLGQLNGKPWTQALAGGPRPLQLRQRVRVEGVIDHPAAAVIEAVQAHVLDAQGSTRATHTVKLQS